MRKKKFDPSILLVRDLSKFIIETGCIPVPKYSDKKYKKTLVHPRTIWAMNRPYWNKNKPIDF